MEEDKQLRFASSAFLLEEVALLSCLPEKGENIMIKKIHSTHGVYLNVIAALGMISILAQKKNKAKVQSLEKALAKEKETVKYVGADLAQTVVEVAKLRRELQRLQE